MKKQYSLIFLAIVTIFATLLLSAKVYYEIFLSQNHLIQGSHLVSSGRQSRPIGDDELESQALRFALLIGNQAYQKGYLENPSHDVDDMEKSLVAVGFKVRSLKDQNLWEMEQAIIGFGHLLAQYENTIGLFYFSGHGMQYQGENFLFPIGAMSAVAIPGHLRHKTLNVEYLLETMAGAGNRLNLIFLDACRDNSFGKGWFKGGKMQPGLAPVQAPSGSLIAYATGANRRALDGKGQRNSPYARYLKQEILKPGISIFEMLTNVRVAVKQATNNAQEPAFYSNLDGQFCFQGPCGQLPLMQPSTVTPPPQPGTIFRDQLSDGSWGPEMVMIPAGHFQMGDLQGKGFRNEQPVHEVSVAQFAIGRSELTVGEFRQFVNTTGYKTDAEKAGDCWRYTQEPKKNQQASWHQPNFFQTDRHPVVCVSWNDVIAYTQWLSQQTGQQYRLPTEAEWEYAARAGLNTNYWWGNEVGSNQANCRNDECDDHFEYTAPVNSFRANPFALYDTAGNVWEWTCSAYESTYQGAEQHCNNNGNLFALRGGSWDINVRGVRSASRNWDKTTDRYIDVGVRLARQRKH